MRCCIVRHGETSWNADSRLQGHQDISLNSLGLAQAEAAGDYLRRLHRTKPFSKVVSSDLLRARQTAEAIGRALEMDVALSKGLRERFYGQFEGKTPNEAEVFAPDPYAELVARSDLEASPCDAEPLQDMVNRIERFLKELAENCGDLSIIIVTHGGVLDILYRRAMDRSLVGPRDAPIPNAGMNWIDIEVQNERLTWTMIDWGKTDHLGSASRDEIL